MEFDQSRLGPIIFAAIIANVYGTTPAALGREAELQDVASQTVSKLLIESITVVADQTTAQRVAGSADFLNASDLEKFDYGDINRLLRRLPGIYIQEEDGFGLRPNIGLRATGLDRSGKITLMEDSVLIAPAPYAAPAAYYFPHVARISAVEVVKGPGAIKYGPYTVGGAVNLFSTPVPEEDSVNAEILFGSDSFLQVHAHGGLRFDLSDALEFGVSGEALKWQSDGFKTLDSGGTTGFNIDDYVGKVELVSRHLESVTQSLQIKAQYSDELSDETYLGLTDADFAAMPFRRYRGSQRDQMNAEHHGYQATYKADFQSGLSATVVAYRNEFGRDWFKLDNAVDPIVGSINISDLLENHNAFPGAFNIIVGEPGFVSADDVLAVKHNNRSYISKGIQTALVIPFELGASHHELTGSVRYHNDRMDRFQWVDRYRMDNGTMVLTNTGVPGTDSNRIDAANAWASYLHDEIIVDRWVLTPGVRIEAIDLLRQDYGKADPERIGHDLKTMGNSVTAVLPGIGVTYQVSDPVLAFAGVHRGFTPPAPGKTANKETSVNYESGVRYAARGNYVEGIGFFTDYKNLTGTCTNSTGGGCIIGDQFDAGAVHTYGLEATLGSDLASTTGYRWSVPLDIAYTFTRGRFQKSFDSAFAPWGNVVKGDDLPYIPRHQVTFSLGIVDLQWNFLGTLNYVAKTRSEAGRGPIPISETVDSRIVVDLAGEIAVTEYADIILRVENLFDTVYSAARRPAGLRPGKPFTLKFGLKIGI